MTELKTLKDIDGADMYINGEKNDRIITKSCLKAEAIKWVKEFEKRTPFSNKDAIWDKIHFIKHFFNLTEEDIS